MYDLSIKPMGESEMKSLFSFFAILCIGASSFALQPDDRVGNFRLFDHAGGSHHLHYFSDMDAVVIMAQDTSCSSFAEDAQQLAASAASAENVQFFMLNSVGENRQTAGSISQLPVLMDEAQLVGRDFEVNHAGEVFVINPKTWSVSYRGDVSGLDAAIAATKQGKKVESIAADGCAIEFADTTHQEVTYVDDVAPILADNCVNCHRPGGIGPWAMSDYNMVRGFSLMIREVLLTQRMPPWHADPEVGHWSNDRSLERHELQTLVNWIDAGAPRGEGDDPLTAYQSTLPRWGSLGEPDLIIDIPPTEIPATGVVDYQYKYVKNPLDRDVWVRASTIVPGERAVLHHVITRFGSIETEGRRKGRISRNAPIGGLAGYVPGMEIAPLPEGTGTLLPAGATLEFQMHYTPTGVAATDHSQIGIYFHEEPPEHKINSLILANGRIKIPPHTKNHSEQAVREFMKDALVFEILPHSHFRGKAAKFVAHYPDGTEEVLLNVPNYDFNWQTTYEFSEPRVMPAGTKIVYTNWWDNSAQNPANPDPSKTVTWGDQSFEEMIFGAIMYRDLDPSEGEQIAGSE